MKFVHLIFLVACLATNICQGDLVHDFGTDEIIWPANQSTVTWDSDGDLIDDFSLSVAVGFLDPVSGLYVIDNFSTADGGIEKTFAFSIASLNPTLPNTEISLLGFNFYSEKNIEVGGNGGAGSISAVVLDDNEMLLAGGITISGSLGSNPSRVDIPSDTQTSWFTLAIDPNSPPSNDDAQVILGNIIINGGTARAFGSVPEPSTVSWLMIALCGWSLRRHRVPSRVLRTERS